MPKISIVLPCYNGERFLKYSLDSILRQTMTNWELIIVDDCSDDMSGRIADEYAAHDNRIRVIHNKKNRKLPGALNDGFSVSSGEYLTWTSDDNVCRPEWLATLSKYLDTHPDTDMVCANMDIINENGKIYGVWRHPFENVSQNELAYKCNVGAAFMYRRTIADKVGRYDEDMFCAEDYDYWVRIALAGKIDYINDNIYMYRTNQHSLTSTHQDRIRNKTMAVKNKYRDAWRAKIPMGWWQRKKFDFLMRNPYCKSELSLVGARYALGNQLANILLFWNPKLRHKFKRRIQITI